MARSLATIPSIPTTQKAILFHEDGGKLELKDIPVPTPGPNDILVNIKYSGVCNTDYHIWKNDIGVPREIRPLVLGHEGAGVVVAKGDNVTNFEIGDNAGVKWISSTCQTCKFCVDSHEYVCPSQKNSGYTSQGTYQQYAVANAFQAASIPKGVDLAKAAPILCAGLTSYKALKDANLKAGQWVTIIGAGGGLGSLAVEYAKVLGYKIIGVDHSSKKDFVLSRGANEFVAFDGEEPVPERIMKITTVGTDAVVNVSSSLKSYNEAPFYIAPHGTLCVVGFPSEGTIISPDVMALVDRALTIKGCAVGNRSDLREAFQFFAEGKINSEVNVVGLSEVSGVFKLMEEKKIMGRYVVDTSR